MGLVLLVLGIGAALWLFNWAVDRWSKSDDGETAARNKEQWDRAAEDDQKFLDSADLMDATVLSAISFGRQNLRPNVEFRLRIEGPDGPYEAEVTQTIDPMQAHRFAEGCKVEVFVDRENPKNVRLCRG